VGTAEIDPCVIKTEYYTHKDNSSAYKVTGLSVVLLYLVREKMKWTAGFLAIPLKMELDSCVKETAELRWIYLMI
jgi:hypothetical protein